jgi:hypothetical protein
MKDYSVNWDPSGVYPEITREYLGILPEFFIHATQALGEDHTLDSLTEAMDEVYGFGGFQYPFGGTVADSGAYKSPEDPDLQPYATIAYLDRFTMYCYPYAITAIRDNDTGETKIGRFD